MLLTIHFFVCSFICLLSIFPNFFHILISSSKYHVLYNQFLSKDRLELVKPCCRKVYFKVSLIMPYLSSLLKILNLGFQPTNALHEQCPYSELFWYECGKIRTRITLNKDTFYAVIVAKIVLV